MTATPDPDISVAVAVGRLEEGQRNILKIVEGMDKKLDGALADISIIKRDQAVTRNDVDDLKEWRKSTEPKINEAHNAAETAKAQSARKPPWTAIGAFVVAAGALAKSIFFP